MKARVRRHERGADPVEFILVLMMMAILLVFFVDFGKMFAIRAEVVEASRNVARAISVGEQLPDICGVYNCLIVPSNCADRHKGDEISATVSFTIDFLPWPDWIVPPTVTSTTVMYMQEDC